jgi:hypothetical protein
LRERNKAAAARPDRRSGSGRTEADRLHGGTSPCRPEASGSPPTAPRFRFADVKGRLHFSFPSPLGRRCPQGG